MKTFIKFFKTIWVEIATNSIIAWRETRSFFWNLGKWVANLWFLYWTTKSQYRVFVGYGHYWFAQKYADKRTIINSVDKIRGRKRHYVLPFGKYSLIVVNRGELKKLIDLKVFSKSINIVYLLENAYYISK